MNESGISSWLWSYIAFNRGSPQCNGLRFRAPSHQLEIRRPARTEAGEVPAESRWLWRGAIGSERRLQRLLNGINPLLADLVRAHRFGDHAQEVVDVRLLLVPQRGRVLLKSSVRFLERRCHFVAPSTFAPTAPSENCTETDCPGATCPTRVTGLPPASRTIANPRPSVFAGPCPVISRTSASLLLFAS